MPSLTPYYAVTISTMPSLSLLCRHFLYYAVTISTMLSLSLLRGLYYAVLHRAQSAFLGKIFLSTVLPLQTRRALSFTRQHLWASGPLNLSRPKKVHINTPLYSHPLTLIPSYPGSLIPSYPSTYTLGPQHLYSRTPALITSDPSSYTLVPQHLYCRTPALITSDPSSYNLVHQL